MVYAVVSGPAHGWGSAHVLLPAPAGLLLVAAFAQWERRTAHPMLDPAFFRNRRFTGAVTGVLLVTFGSAGVLFLLTQQLQFVRGYPPLEAGLRTAPFALTVVALNFTGLTARLIARLGTPRSIALGMAVLAAGFTVAAFAADGYGPLLAGPVLTGTGCAVANPAIVGAVVGAVPQDRAGGGAGIDGAMAEVGSSLGVAALGAVMNARLTAVLPAAASVPAALAAARTEADRTAVLDAFTAASAPPSWSVPAPSSPAASPPPCCWPAPPGTPPAASPADPARPGPAPAATGCPRLPRPERPHSDCRTRTPGGAWQMTPASARGGPAEGARAWRTTEPRPSHGSSRHCA